MRASTLQRHFREGFKNILRNGWMTIASVSSVTVTLLIVGIFLVIMMNLNFMATTIEEDVEIRVHVDLTATEQQEEELRGNIERISEVDTISFSSKEEELEQIIKSFGEEGQAFESLRAENPLHDVFVIKAKNPTDTSKIASKIETFSYVEKVNYGKETVDRLFNILKIARTIGLALVIGLIFTAMFLIANTIKITIVARRQEIEIMKLVGATNNFIRWPFFLEGLILGTLGAIIPIILLTLGYSYLDSTVNEQLQTSFFLQLLPFHPFAYNLAGILLLIGAFIGVWGSMVSIRKFLKV